MTYFYYRDNGDVVMQSPDLQTTSLNYVRLTVSSDDQDKLDANWKATIVSGALVMVAPDNLVRESTVTDIRTLISAAVTVDDVKTILTDILNLTYS